MNGWAVFGWSLVADVVFLTAGNYAGRRFAERCKLNVSWLSGVVLIGLAVMRLV